MMNYFRESGYSGERTFISNHGPSSESIAFDYVSSLTEHEIEELKHHSIANAIGMLKYWQKAKINNIYTQPIEVAQNSGIFDKIKSFFKK